MKYQTDLKHPLPVYICCQYCLLFFY